MADHVPAGIDVTLHFEMGYTPAEFRQRMPAFADVTYDAARAQFDCVEDGRSWSLRLINPRRRAIALVRVPIVDVELMFRGYSRCEIDAFMRRFQAWFHRGGG
jgi:hypothetical protein